MKLRLFSVGVVLLLALPANAQIVTGSGMASIGPSNLYSQNFDSPNLAPGPTGGTSNLLPTGWYFVEQGTGADNTYGIDNGNNAAPNVYSYGTDLSLDRAFGTLRDAGSSFAPMIGVVLMNNTGLPIFDNLLVRYTGEQWRQGSAVDRLDFQINQSATSITDPGFVDFNLDFTSPTTGSPGPTDGNLAQNRLLRSANMAVNIAPGASFAIRWVDPLTSGADAGLAIDDFSVQVLPEPSVILLTTAGLGCIAGSTWWQKRRAASRSSYSVQHG